MERKKQRILFTASTYSHIVNFHRPYLRAFAALGYEVDVACGGTPMEIPEARRLIHLPLEKSMTAPANLRAAGLLLISGQMTTHFQVKADLGYPGEQFAPVIDALAPMRYCSKHLPPMLLVTGESPLEMPARTEENAFMAASCRALGHPKCEHYILGGHDHGSCVDSCDHLALRFIDEVLAR